MGTLKMLHMKQCKGKNKAKHLKNALEYIFNPEKFSQRWMGGNAGGCAQEVYDNMIRLKQAMGKETGRQGYHYVLTFLPGEVDEGLACKITEEFCQLFFKENVQHTHVLHTDKVHFHSHIIFNSIDMEGKKYRYEKGDWAKKIQPVVNELCKKHGLSEINLEKVKAKEKNKTEEEKVKEKKDKSEETGGGVDVKKKEPEKKQNHNQQGSMKWRKIRKGIHKQVKTDIRAAILQATSMEEFFEIMKAKRYSIHQRNSKVNGAYITFRQEGKQGVRSYTLGDGYLPEDILYQIKNKDKIFLSDVSFENDDVWGKKYQSIYYQAPDNLKELFRKNTYLIRNWNGERLSLYPQMYKYRADLEAVAELEEGFNYIKEMGIKDMKEVTDKLHYITYKLKELGKLRYEMVESEEMDDVVREEKLVDITTTYKRYMKEKRVLEGIQKREEKMREHEKEIQEEKNKINIKTEKER